LDVSGTLPTAQQVESFLTDPSPEKRSKKIDELLQSPGYAAWWATKLSDFTGNNDDQLIFATPLPQKAGELWYEWIHRRVRENTPYDQLAAGIVLAVSRQEGESYSEYCKKMSDICRPESQTSFADRPYMPFYWARIGYRHREERAVSFAYAFLGIRIECAQCHKHPFDRWSKSDFQEFSNFFGDVTAANAPPNNLDEYNQLLHGLNLTNENVKGVRREAPKLLQDGKILPFPEVFVGSRQKPAGRQRPAAAKRSKPARLLAGELVDLNKHQDARAPLMDWLRAPDSPYFAKAFVNRVWAAYFGRGIVEPPDDLSLANPPSNQPLMDYLARGFVEHDFDMKWVHREILNSRTYQLSWRPNETNAQDQRNFARAFLRRLPAEVIYDAVRQASACDGIVENMQTSMVDRAIAATGAGVRVNTRKNLTYALSVFGRSSRDTNCDCDRNSVPSLLQTIFLQNDYDVLTMLSHPTRGWIQQLEFELAGGPSAMDQIPERLKTQLAELEERFDVSLDRDNREQATKVSQRLNDVKQSALRVVRQRNSHAAATDRPNVEQLINRAYLRTLSRHPTPEEVNRCSAFIEQSENPLDGLRDLVWTLINTKEFIVNH
jgi:hypothetical protein